MKQHPCHACNDREAHARWAERWWRLKRETDQLSGQIRGAPAPSPRSSTGSPTCSSSSDYLGRRPTARSRSPRPAARCAASTANATCSSPSACGAASGTASTPRPSPRWPRPSSTSRAARAPTRASAGCPRGPFRAALEATEQIWAELDDLEAEHRLPGERAARRPDSRSPRSAGRGARRSTACCAEADLAAGDFVRWMKQAIDLLDQISIVADGELGRTARASIDGIRRGIVAYSSVA